MKTLNLLIAAALFGAMTLATATAQEASKKAGPTTRPASKVIATVGKAEITSDKLQMAMQRMRINSKEQALAQLVIQALIEAYADSVPCTDKDIAEWKANMVKELAARKLGSLDKFLADRKLTKDDIPRMVRFEKLEAKAMKAASAEAVDALTKAHPTYFDGTKVQASHILLSCGPGAGDAERGEIRKQLDQIGADIKAGKVKFEDAAKKHSKCPSGAKGGDLGPFAFHSMVTPFSQMAFSMKVGDVSGIVETQFGFHIIKVTKNTPGTGKVGPNAQQIAKRTLLGNFRDEVIAEARKDNPVTIIK